MYLSIFCYIYFRKKYALSIQIERFGILARFSMHELSKYSSLSAYPLLFQKGGSAREKEWTGIESPLFFHRGRRKSAGVSFTISADFYREKSPKTCRFLTS